MFVFFFLQTVKRQRSDQKSSLLKGETKLYFDSMGFKPALFFLEIKKKVNLISRFLLTERSINYLAGDFLPPSNIKCTRGKDQFRKKQKSYPKFLELKAFNEGPFSQ